jgi:ferric-dicitrate binding protein FerR (iron transport regulator)
LTKPLPKKVKKIVFWQKSFYKYAALFILPMLLGTLYYFTSIYDKTDKIVWLEKQTQRGERLEFFLSDGSKVSLNSESKLIYPQEFSSNLRQVKLEGEAFFEVKKNTKKAFIVHANNLDIKVLGTKFNVKSYSTEKYIETTLLSGKVSVALKDTENKIVRKAILLPNQQANYAKESMEVKLHQVDAEHFASWREGKLIIDEKPFAEVCRELERWFNVNIQLDKELHQKYFYTITITNEPLEEILLYLKRTTPSLIITYNNNKILINEKK